MHAHPHTPPHHHTTTTTTPPHTTTTPPPPPHHPPFPLSLPFLLPLPPFILYPFPCSFSLLPSPTLHPPLPLPLSPLPSPLLPSSPLLTPLPPTDTHSMRTHTVSHRSLTVAPSKTQWLNRSGWLFPRGAALGEGFFVSDTVAATLLPYLSGAVRRRVAS